MKHVQLLPGVLCKLIILGAPAHRRNYLRKDLRVRSQSLGWAGVSACWSCGELEEGVGGRISSWPQPDLNPTHPTASQIQRSSPDLKEGNFTRSILLTPCWQLCEGNVANPSPPQNYHSFLLCWTWLGWYSWWGSSCRCWWGYKASLPQRTHFVIWPRPGVTMTCSEERAFWHGSYKDNASFLSCGFFSLTMHIFWQKGEFLKAVKVSEGSVEEDGKGKGMRAVLLKSEGNFWGGDRSFLVALNLILALVAASPAVQVVQKDIFCQGYCKMLHYPISNLFNRWKDPFEWAIIVIFRAFSWGFVVLYFLPGLIAPEPKSSS